MTNQQFVHLHLHSQYSLLDGANQIEKVIKLAASLGQPAIALTDHGNMHGAIEFYEYAHKAGIKPIIGCELYLTPGSRHDKKPKTKGGDAIHHLTVLAQNLSGYHNLCRLVTLAYKEGFYHKPRVDRELLTQCSDGLIILSGCMSSELGVAAQHGNDKLCREIIEFYAKTFPDRYYLEVQPHQLEEQFKLNEICAHFAQQMGLPIVATNDCHYPTPDYHLAQEVLMCISTGKLLSSPDHIKHEGVTLSLKTYQEMLSEFGSVSFAEQALANSLRIADQINLEFDFSKHYLPRVGDYNDQQLFDLMCDQAKQGLQERFLQFRRTKADFDGEQERIYQLRLTDELDQIKHMGFAGYFLVVADFINWAKNNQIPVGPGRGSGAGSLVAYAMRITEVDPIEHKLLFERFLNPERVSLPDIDVDFCINGRDAVIKYVVEKYGSDRVAQICTFGTLKAKAAIKDVGRVLGISYAETDKVAQLVPAPRQGFDYPLEEAMKMEKRLAEYAEGDGRELIELALKLEGLTRHSSTHAAGVVIGDRPLIELVPMMVDKDNNDVTQYSMKYVERVGLLKFDFLGLKTLTVIKAACDIIEQSQQTKIDPNNLALDDAKTYSLLCSGNTTGVFQLESSGISEITMRLKPNCFDDLVAILALYRPGPLDAGMVDHYIDRKHGRQEIKYLHPLMEPILSDTYGIIVYQEQIMQLARVLAGYSLGEADLLRRAMGKKNPEEMAKQRTRFVDGATKHNISIRESEEIFDQMETFARYGFNRSHSAAYAMITYQTAYLKAHYPVEFMAALMSLEMSDTDKTQKNLTECKKHAIEILPPSVNQSQSGFSVLGSQIRFGLSAIKGVGEKAVEIIIAERIKSGNFIDLEDFAERVDIRLVNKRVFENFAKSGAFDEFSLSRAEMFSRIDDLLRAAQSLAKEQDSNQVPLFAAHTEIMNKIPRRMSNAPEWASNQKLALEREALGFYLSGHPLEKYAATLRAFGAVSTMQAVQGGAREQVTIGGVVTALKLRNTKRGDRYASFILEDDVATISAIMWPSGYEKYGQYLQVAGPIIAKGRLDASEERAVLMVDSLDSLADACDRKATQGILNFTRVEPHSERLEILHNVLKEHSGNCPVKVKVAVGEQEVFITLRDNRQVPICVRPSEALREEVEQIFGSPVFSFI